MLLPSAKRPAKLSTNVLPKLKLQPWRSIQHAKGYRSVATRGSVIYFVVANLALVDPMYQYSAVLQGIGDLAPGED